MKLAPQLGIIVLGTILANLAWMVVEPMVRRRL